MLLRKDLEIIFNNPEIKTDLAEVERLYHGKQNKAMEEKKMNEKRTKEAIITDIIQYFKENEDVFNDCMEELDSYNGYLGDDRYYDMEELNDLYSGQEPQEILFRAFYGFDADMWMTDSSGNKEYGAFNPNRNYFYFNGYGNLVSSDYKDYSDKLDGYAIEEMSENRNYIDSIENDDILAGLFDELEGVCENE